MKDIRATLEQRGTKYGPFEGHALISQRLKQVMQNSPAWQKGWLSVDKAEALEMIMHKIARILNGDPNYDDSWRDIIGYTQLVLDTLQSTTEEQGK